MPKLKRHEVRVWAVNREGGDPRMVAMPVYEPPQEIGPFTVHETFSFRFYLTLTHTASGMAVAKKLTSLEVAHNLAEVLCHLANWALPKKGIAKLRAGDLEGALAVSPQLLHTMTLVCKLAQR